tara:strand:- start:740 stop:1696 length:957 start_codon:yes stop_codon:yes gene_type:complete
MRLVNYLYFKFLYALFISSTSCLLIFYIFSLISNLEEKMTFSSILYLSLLNSLQIITQIPSFISLLSLVLFVIFLKSKNELMVIKEYYSSVKIIMIFLPAVFILSIFELNKSTASNKMSDLKLSLIDKSTDTNTKVIINKNSNFKSYIVLKGLDFNNFKVSEFQKFEISGNQIIGGEFSNDLNFNNNNIVANKITRFKSDQIMSIDKAKIVLDNINKILGNNFIIYDENDDKIFKIKLRTVGKFIYYILFFLSIILILINKKIVDRKNNILISIFLCFLLLIYSTIIPSVNLVNYNTGLQILSIIFIAIVFLRYLKYE